MNLKELKESMGYRIPAAEKKTIEHFVQGKPHGSKSLSTDGKKLDGAWIGGSGLASHQNNEIHVRQALGNVSQTYHNAIHKEAKKQTIKSITV